MRHVVDGLESRTFLAGQTVISPGLAHITSKGTLVVSGTNADDEITVTRDATTGSVLVRRTPLTSSPISTLVEIPSRSVKRILVEAGGGHDKVTLKGNLAPTTVLGGGGNDKIDAYSGKVTLNGGAGRDSIRHLRDGNVTYGQTLVIRSGEQTAITAYEYTDGTSVQSVSASASTLGPRGSAFPTQINPTGIVASPATSVTTGISLAWTVNAFATSSLIGGDGDDTLVTEYDGEQIDGGRGVDAVFHSGDRTANFVNGVRPTSLRLGSFGDGIDEVYSVNAESFRELD